MQFTILVNAQIAIIFCICICVKLADTTCLPIHCPPSCLSLSVSMICCISLTINISQQFLITITSTVVCLEYQSFISYCTSISYKLLFVSILTFNSYLQVYLCFSHISFHISNSLLVSSTKYALRFAIIALYLYVNLQIESMLSLESCLSLFCFSLTEQNSKPIIDKHRQSHVLRKKVHGIKVWLCEAIITLVLYPSPLACSEKRAWYTLSSHTCINYLKIGVMYACMPNQRCLESQANNFARNR